MSEAVRRSDFEPSIINFIEGFYFFAVFLAGLKNRSYICTLNR